MHQEQQWELDNLNKNVENMWNVYTKWYTFFFGSSLLIISWVFDGLDDAKETTVYTFELSIIWILFSVMGAYSSFKFVHVLDESRKRMQEIITILNQKNEHQIIRPANYDIGVHSAYGCFISLVVLVLVWLRIASISFESWTSQVLG